jgi:hypothetical protein
VPTASAHVFACVDRPWPQGLRLTPAEMAPFFTGIDTGSEWDPSGELLRAVGGSRLAASRPRRLSIGRRGYDRTSLDQRKCADAGEFRSSTPLFVPSMATTSGVRDQPKRKQGVSHSQVCENKSKNQDVLRSRSRESREFANFIPGESLGETVSRI